MEKKRLGNFDLFRIFSMFIIVLFHYVSHGNFIFDNPNINNVLLVLIGSYGLLGVLCFISISSHFLYNFNSKFSTKKLIKLLIETTIFSLSFYLILYIMNHYFEFRFKGILYIEDLKDLPRNTFPIFYYTYWFMSIYFIFYVISPILKVTVKKLNRKYLKFFLIFFGIFLIISLFTKVSILGRLFMFIYIYIIIAYLSKYPKNYISKNYKKLSIIAFTVTIGSILISYYIMKINNNSLESEAIYKTIISISSPLMVIDAILLYLIFKNITFNGNRLIKTIGSSTLGIYIIHEHDYFHHILFDYVFKRSTLHYSKFLFIKCISSCVIIFLICSVLSIVTIKILNISLYKILDRIEIKYLNRIDDICNIK